MCLVPTPTVRLSFAVTLLLALAYSANADVQVVEAVRSQLPQPPAGGLDPSKLPDIIGMRVGTPTDKFIAQMNSLYPRDPKDPNSRGTSYIKYAPTNDPPYISSMLFQRPFPEGCNPGGNCKDEVRVIYSGPPDARAVRISRQVGYNDAKRRPTSDTLKAALVQKYGPDFAQFPVMTLVWAFDEEGKPLAQQE